MIELRHITKHFGGVPALDDVSLEIRPFERLALVGENGAGKSSLMNVLYGLYQPDRGEVCFEGAAVKVKTPAEALARGVGMVHQHFTLVPTLTVAENVVLGREPTRWGRLDRERAIGEVKATCQKLGFLIDPSAKVSELSVGAQQKVEIVKAIHRGAKTLILDEPTAVLTPQEADELFAVTRALSEQGLSVVLISHKLREVLSFSTRIAVMRRGRMVAETTPSQCSPRALASLMLGEAAEPPEAKEPEEASVTAPGVRNEAPLLALEGLQARGLQGVSLQVRPGEILGIAGVDGNGQRELAEVLTGLRPWDSGTLAWGGRKLTQWSPSAARALGLAHIPEDRLRRALISDLTVEENAALGRQRHRPFAKGPLIDFAGRRASTAALMEANDVRPRAPTLRAGALSGGNQQKLVVAREVAAAPKLLVVVQPTRGLDIAAVRAVRSKLLHLRSSGCAMLLFSLDLDEVLELSDRILVLCGGKVTGEFPRTHFDERLIGRRMLGVLDA